MRSAAVSTGSAELIDGVLAGRQRSIGRAISAMERGAEASGILEAIYPHTGRARILGITGPPGAGKSTLVRGLAQAYRRQKKTVGIVAVDPSSPFTGGALLGDRIRMTELYTDPGVFIRSMATRGALGGLARATSDAVDVLDAAGFDLVLIETVGVGQDEVDVVRAAQTTAVVLVPGLGDDIQAIKAGILEIADVFVVNKADREGADRAVAELSMMLDFTPERIWRPPIVKTVAPRGEGIDATVAALESHGEHLAATPEGASRMGSRARARLLTILEDRFRRAIESRAPEPDGLEEAVRALAARRVDPYSAAESLFDGVVRSRE